ncbi:hypothetical protein ACKH85_004141, partial [Shigella flexneri]
AAKCSCELAGNRLRRSVVSGFNGAYSFSDVDMFVVVIPSVYSFSPYTKPCRPSWFILRHRAGRSRGQTPLARTSP